MKEILQIPAGCMVGDELGIFVVVLQKVHVKCAATHHRFSLAGWRNCGGCAFTTVDSQGGINIAYNLFCIIDESAQRRNIEANQKIRPLSG